MKINAIEEMARVYVELCGDKAEAIRRLRPAHANKSDAACEKIFDKNYSDLPQFWRRVEQLQKLVDEKIAMSAAELMQHWSNLARVDVANVVQVKSRPCAACYEGPVSPSVGPNPECPHCGGVGYQFVALTPTEKLAPNERMLFDGAEMTKHGIKINWRSRDAIEDKIARARGMFVDRTVLEDKTAADLPPLPDDPNEAAKIYANWVKGC